MSTRIIRTPLWPGWQRRERPCRGPRDEQSETQATTITVIHINNNTTGVLSITRGGTGATGRSARERDEGRMVADAPDQAERRARPRERRALSTARPPRVRMRVRNPCFFLRFRLLGWNVRFTMAP